jgi:molybdopterin molybdotransferase
MSGLTPFAEAVAWIDREIATPLAAESVPLAAAPGRVLAEDVVARCDAPPFDRTTVEGWAVKAEETLGANLYNPLLLPAKPVAAGARLPPGTDALVPVEAAESRAGGSIEVVEPVHAGAGVERRGESFAAGTVVVQAGRLLGPAELGLLVEAGIGEAVAVRRPRVRILALLGVPQAAMPMLEGLIARDGGIADRGNADRDSPRSLGAAAAMPGADIVFVLGACGRSDADAALRAAAGTIAMHGVALRPGSAIGLGHAGALPLFVLPESPADCLWAYELLAGRAVRRRAGLPPDPPYVAGDYVAARKIVSAVGLTEVRPVRRIADREEVEPVTGSGLFAAAGAADGFVIVPEGSEGVAPGGRVRVYLYDRQRKWAADG